MGKNGFKKFDYSYGVGLTMEASSFKSVKDELKKNMDTLSKMVKGYSKVLEINPDADLSEVFSELSKMKGLMEGIAGSDNALAGFIDKGILDRIKKTEDAMASLGAQTTQIKDMFSTMLAPLMKAGEFAEPVRFQQLFGDIPDVSKQIKVMEGQAAQIEDIAERIQKAKENLGDTPIAIETSGTKEIQAKTKEFKQLKTELDNMLEGLSAKDTVDISDFDEIEKVISRISKLSLEIDGMYLGLSKGNKTKIDDTKYFNSYRDAFDDFCDNIDNVVNNITQHIDIKKKEVANKLNDLLDIQSQSKQKKNALSGLGASFDETVQVTIEPKANKTTWSRIIDEILDEIGPRFLQLKPTFKSHKNLTKNIDDELAEISHKINTNFEITTNFDEDIKLKVKTVKGILDSIKNQLDKKTKFKIGFEWDESKDFKKVVFDMIDRVKRVDVTFKIKNGKNFYEQTKNLTQKLTDLKTVDIELNMTNFNEVMSNITKISDALYKISESFHLDDTTITVTPIGGGMVGVPVQGTTPVTPTSASIVVDNIDISGAQVDITNSVVEESKTASEKVAKIRDEIKAVEKGKFSESDMFMQTHPELNEKVKRYAELCDKRIADESSAQEAISTNTVTLNNLYKKHIDNLQKEVDDTKNVLEYKEKLGEANSLKNVDLNEASYKDLVALGIADSQNRWQELKNSNKAFGNVFNFEGVVSKYKEMSKTSIQIEAAMKDMVPDSSDFASYSRMLTESKSIKDEAERVIKQVIQDCIDGIELGLLIPTVSDDNNDLFKMSEQELRDKHNKDSVSLKFLQDNPGEFARVGGQKAQEAAKARDEAIRAQKAAQAVTQEEVDLYNELSAAGDKFVSSVKESEDYKQLQKDAQAEVESKKEAARQDALSRIDKSSAEKKHKKSKNYTEEQVYNDLVEIEKLKERKNVFIKSTKQNWNAIAKNNLIDLTDVLSEDEIENGLQGYVNKFFDDIKKSKSFYEGSSKAFSLGEFKNLIHEQFDYDEAVSIEREVLEAVRAKNEAIIKEQISELEAKTRSYGPDEEKIRAKVQKERQLELAKTAGTNKYWNLVKSGIGDPGRRLNALRTSNGDKYNNITDVESLVKDYYATASKITRDEKDPEKKGSQELKDLQKRKTELHNTIVDIKKDQIKQLEADLKQLNAEKDSKAPKTEVVDKKGSSTPTSTPVADNKPQTTTSSQSNVKYVDGSGIAYMPAATGWVMQSRSGADTPLAISSAQDAYLSSIDDKVGQILSKLGSGIEVTSSNVGIDADSVTVSNNSGKIDEKPEKDSTQSKSKQEEKVSGPKTETKSPDILDKEAVKAIRKEILGSENIKDATRDLGIKDAIKDLGTLSNDELLDLNKTTKKNLHDLNKYKTNAFVLAELGSYNTNTKSFEPDANIQKLMDNKKGDLYGSVKNALGHIRTNTVQHIKQYDKAIEQELEKRGLKVEKYQTEPNKGTSNKTEIVTGNVEVKSTGEPKTSTDTKEKLKLAQNARSLLENRDPNNYNVLLDTKIGDRNNRVKNSDLSANSFKELMQHRQKLQEKLAEMFKNGEVNSPEFNKISDELKQMVPVLDEIVKDQLEYAIQQEEAHSKTVEALKTETAEMQKQEGLQQKASSDTSDISALKAEKEELVNKLQQMNNQGSRDPQVLDQTMTRLHEINALLEQSEKQHIESSTKQAEATKKETAALEEKTEELKEQKNLQKETPSEVKQDNVTTSVDTSKEEKKVARLKEIQAEKEQLNNRLKDLDEKYVDLVNNGQRKDTRKQYALTLAKMTNADLKAQVESFGLDKQAHIDKLNKQLEKINYTKETVKKNITDYGRKNYKKNYNALLETGAGDKFGQIQKAGRSESLEDLVGLRNNLFNELHTLTEKTPEYEKTLAELRAVESILNEIAQDQLTYANQLKTVVNSELKELKKTDKKSKKSETSDGSKTSKPEKETKAQTKAVGSTKEQLAAEQKLAQAAQETTEEKQEQADAAQKAASATEEQARKDKTSSQSKKQQKLASISELQKEKDEVFNKMVELMDQDKHGSDEHKQALSRFNEIEDLQRQQMQTKFNASYDTVKRFENSNRTLLHHPEQLGMLETKSFERYKQAIDELKLKRQEVQNSPMISADDLEALSKLELYAKNAQNEFNALHSIRFAKKSSVNDVSKSTLEGQIDQLSKYEQQLIKSGLYTEEFQDKISNLYDQISRISTNGDLDMFKTDFSRVKADFVEFKTFTEQYNNLIASKAKELELQYKIDNDPTSSAHLTEELKEQQKITGEIEERLGLYGELYNAEAKQLAQTRAQEKAQQSITSSESKQYAKDVKKQNREIASAVRKYQSKYNKFTNKDVGGKYGLDLSDGALQKLKQYSMLLDELRAKQQSALNNPGLLNDEQFNSEIESIINTLNQFDTELAKIYKSSEQLFGNIRRADDIKIIDIIDPTDANDMKKLHTEMQEFANAAGRGEAKLIGFDDRLDKLTGTFEIKNMKGEVQQLEVAYDKATNALGRYISKTKETATVGQRIKNELLHGFKNAARYLASFGGIYEVIAEIRRGITYVKEIDDALTELKKVTNETDAGYERFLQTMSKTSSVVGSTVAELTQMAAEWSRLNYTIEEAAGLAESTAVLLNVSEFEDATTASEALISTIQAFGYTAEESMDVVDIMNEIGKYIACR